VRTVQSGEQPAASVNIDADTQPPCGGPISLNCLVLDVRLEYEHQMRWPPLGTAMALEFERDLRRPIALDRVLKHDPLAPSPAGPQDRVPTEVARATSGLDRWKLVRE
jgi:hypothetical protein